MKKLIIVFLFIISLIVNIKADTCSNTEMTRLKKLAEKVEFTYDYEIQKDENSDGTYEYPKFKITANNLNSELKVLIVNDFYNNDYREFKYNDKKSSTLDNFYEGENVTVTIKAYTANACSSKTVLTKQVKLPYYNYLYDEELCKEYPDFDYCVKLTEKELTLDEYNRAYNDYMSYTEEDIVEENNTNNMIYIYIGGGVVVLIIIILGTISIINKKKRGSL